LTNGKHILKGHITKEDGTNHEVEVRFIVEEGGIIAPWNEES
jgi:hypothetical protein